MFNARAWPLQSCGGWLGGYLSVTFVYYAETPKGTATVTVANRKP